MIKNILSGPRSAVWLRGLTARCVWLRGQIYQVRYPIRPHTIEEIDYEIFSTVISFLSLIQEEQLSVTAGSMSTGCWLTLKALNKNCSRRHFNFLLLSFEENKAWFFMWILCLAEDSLETSSLIFSEKKMEKCLWMSSAAVVIDALRFNRYYYGGLSLPRSSVTAAAATTTTKIVYLVYRYFLFTPTVNRPTDYYHKIFGIAICSLSLTLSLSLSLIWTSYSLSRISVG